MVSTTSHALGILNRPASEKGVRCEKATLLRRSQDAESLFTQRGIFCIL